jgi:hypothetical protein
MDNTFLLKIHRETCRRLNRAKVLLKIVFVFASLGLILSLLTDFPSYEIAGFASGAFIPLFISAPILWYLVGSDLISAFHDLMKTQFEHLGKLKEFFGVNIDPKTLIALR